jgi:hypothetical protein
MPNDSPSVGWYDPPGDEHCPECFLCACPAGDHDLHRLCSEHRRLIADEHKVDYGY